VYSTPCGPCRVEIPYFAKLHAEEGLKGLRVIGVSIDAVEDHQKVLELTPSLGLTYEIWLDPDQRIGGILGSPGVPATLLIDRAGTVLWKHDGAIDEGTPGFREALTLALAPQQ
jgi:thiol-disulfide isomerase/thioredoxin